MRAIVSMEVIEGKILLIRGHKVTGCCPKSISSLIVILNEVKNLFFTIC